ncbi:MAG TPA: ribonuclease H [Lentisphaeria bacterium]|nr:MAG: Ribonuclease H [Parcubacteria group bacterium GW2011_GWF2_38_76]HBM17251.1 ribonuclease H [Lentisphaeria bacterium]
MSELYLNTDGGSRGNPGPAAIGVVFLDDKGNQIHTHKEFIGHATNNEAEYCAIIKALEILSKSKWAEENKKNGKVICRLDSQLVVEQVMGRYKVKKDHIFQFVSKINKLINNLDLQLQFMYVPREENKIADKLVNQALDEVLKNADDKSKSVN